MTQNPEGNGRPEGPGTLPESGVESRGAAPPEGADGEKPEDEIKSNLLPYPIAAIGASAGGLEALTAFLKHFAPESGIAVVIITHLAPDQKSHLVEILGAQTAIPVHVIEGGVQPLPNNIYVLPPNAFASIGNGQLQLEPPPEKPAVRMPIDHFFRSLATDQKSRAIGVILSGADSDGALGLKAIKGEGGIAIVQSPESARHPGMPRNSIAADHVDMVLPPAQIGTELSRLGAHFAAPDVQRLEEAEPRDQPEEQLLSRILMILTAASGIDFRQYKSATLRRRIARRMMLTRIGTLQEYTRHLQSHPAEVQELHEDMLINVTHFFRDRDAFDVLKTDIFPRIFESRTDDQQIRIWAPGCSTGEEVYSIAICLLEFLAGKGVEPPIQIFGTDASERTVQTARVGMYPESIAEDVTPERLRRFFVRTEKGFQINKRIRDLCIFARQNLCNDPPFSRLDLVSCRNVLIYFNHSLQRQIIPTFHYALRPNGFLVLGSSESLREYADLFAVADRKNKIYIKMPSVTTLHLDFPRRAPAAILAESTTGRSTDLWTESELQRAADRIVLARYAPPGVVINDKMEIVQSRGHTSPFLEMPAGAPTLSLLRMLRESIASDVREALEQAIAEDVPVQVKELEVRDGDNSRKFMLEILPVQSTSSQPRCFLVLFVPAPEGTPAAPARADAARPTTEDEKDKFIAQLRRDLASTRLLLQSLVEERDLKNQDLTSANEEIQSANEELQSANEELETTKEEVQSANEELTTVNDELQQRNAVLTQTSNDLNNLLTSVNIPLLMLNSHLEIRQFTPPTQRLINVRQSDVGRPITEITHNLKLDDLRPIVNEVLETLGTRELEVQDREGRWLLMRVHPYRTSDNKIEGVVLVLLDIDLLRRSQEELRKARDFALSLIESVQVPVVVLDTDLSIRTVNSAFRAISALGIKDLERRRFHDVGTLFWGHNFVDQQLENLRSDQDGGFEVEFESRTAIPRVFCVRGQSMEADAERVILLTIEEITERRKAERVLASERLVLQGEIDSTMQALSRTQEELRELAASLFRSQEDERRLVARELHDDISQRLALLDMEIEEICELLKGKPEAAVAAIAELRKRTRSLSEDVRLLSHKLHPSVLEDLGIVPALRALVEDFAKREEMIATFASRNIPENVPRETSSVLYRITQEALRNVAKHAGKTHVKVTLEIRSGQIHLEIADLGEGFDTADTRRGLGLMSMAERARLIGGRLHVESELGQGTRVIVDAPLEPAPEPDRRQ